LRAGGDIALIAWIRLGHSVLMVVTTQLQPQPSPPTHLRSGRSNEEWIADANGINVRRSVRRG
jgi:hypothetical protein